MSESVVGASTALWATAHRQRLATGDTTAISRRIPKRTEGEADEQA